MIMTINHTIEETSAFAASEKNVPATVNFEECAMGVENVVRQINIIQDIMRGVMMENEHYGTIPGTNKPSLYKAGAEKLNLVFRLRPEYTITRYDLPGGHREYEISCTLFHILTGHPVGQGVGSASTMEGKFRYRGGERAGTGNPVPREYWNLKQAGKNSEAQKLLGGPGFTAGKIDGSCQICVVGEKVEHDNPADYYNVILKMAKKRAHVDAILTTTAASDIFTQDVEDMPEVINTKTVLPTTSVAASPTAMAATTLSMPTVEPNNKPIINSTTKTPREQLQYELDTYCPNREHQGELLKKLTLFERDGRQIFVEDINDKKFTNKWIISTMPKIVKLKSESNKVPKGCNENPKLCDHSLFGNDEKYYCSSGGKCLFEIKAPLEDDVPEWVA